MSQQAQSGSYLGCGPTCPYHGTKQICFYCQTCSHVACHACVMYRHRGHVIKDLIVICQQIGQDLSDVLQNCHISSETSDEPMDVRNSGMKH